MMIRSATATDPHDLTSVWPREMLSAAGTLLEAADRYMDQALELLPALEPFAPDEIYHQPVREAKSTLEFRNGLNVFCVVGLPPTDGYAYTLSATSDGHISRELLLRASFMLSRVCVELEERGAHDDPDDRDAALVYLTMAVKCLAMVDHLIPRASQPIPA